ncbi:hypothetical protein NDU88_009027 [Pleurodeles waltl]|uniref:Uncharacterized protein n=1 Tax=Pleurodeles waltl TaxID=8319 RepID=A0AAV7RZU6_PLEWA|nr:hypothetical protein NDU88_009027 [Pleurodeles waltl]
MVLHHPKWFLHMINDSEVLNRRRATNQRASVKRNAKPSEIQPEDWAFLKDRYPGSKFLVPFERGPWSVVKRQGTMVMASQGDDAVTCNVSLFKKVQGPPPRGALNPLDDSDTPAEGAIWTPPPEPPQSRARQMANHLPEVCRSRPIPGHPLNKPEGETGTRSSEGREAHPRHHLL